MPSDAIEREPSHLEINSIFSPSMPILNVFEPISKPNPDPNKYFYTIMTIEIHQDILRIGVMKIIGIPKKSNNNSGNS